jgi:hypothetical protein
MRELHSGMVPAAWPVDFLGYLLDEIFDWDFDELEDFIQGLK